MSTGHGAGKMTEMIDIALNHVATGGTINMPCLPSMVEEMIGKVLYRATERGLLVEVRRTANTVGITPPTSEERSTVRRSSVCENNPMTAAERDGLRSMIGKSPDEIARDLLRTTDPGDAAMTPTTRSDDPPRTHDSRCPAHADELARWTITSQSPTTEQIADEALDAITGGAPGVEIRVATNIAAAGVLSVLYRRAESRGIDASYDATELWLEHRGRRITVTATERALDQAIVRAAESSGALGEARDQARISLSGLRAINQAPDPRAKWRSRVELVNELLDQAEVARQQALLTPHNQGLLAKLVPLLGRAARALEDREQGLPIFLGTSERTTDLIGWVKTNDPMITQKVLASSAILPTVVMGGDDRDEPAIVAYGLVLRTMVDTRPNAHLGEAASDVFTTEDMINFAHYVSGEGAGVDRGFSEDQISDFLTKGKWKGPS